MIDAVQGFLDVLFMNKTLRRKIIALIRSAGQTMEVVSDSFVRQSLDYAGIPIAVVEEDKDGNQILDFTEANSGGGTAASSSIYAVRFGVIENACGLQAGKKDVRSGAKPNEL